MKSTARGFGRVDILKMISVIDVKRALYSVFSFLVTLQRKSVLYSAKISESQSLSFKAKSMKIVKLPFLLIFLALIPHLSFAQNEISRERISLQGLQEFGFTANIEGSREVADHESLTPTLIREQAVEQLVQNDLRYVSDEKVESSADLPFLYMHINTLRLENGLIPFSIELRLYQPVKLTLNRDLQTSASTWETGMVGIVSPDRISLINQAAEGVIAEFIEDYNRVNQR